MSSWYLGANLLLQNILDLCGDPFLISNRSFGADTAKRGVGLLRLIDILLPRCISLNICMHTLLTSCHQISSVALVNRNTSSSRWRHIGCRIDSITIPSRGLIKSVKFIPYCPWWPLLDCCNSFYPIRWFTIHHESRRISHSLLQQLLFVTSLKSVVSWACIHGLRPWGDQFIIQGKQTIEFLLEFYSKVTDLFWRFFLHF